MRRVEIETTCLATLTELWTYDVPDDWTDDQITEAFDSNDDDLDFLMVENVSVDNEVDREVVSIETVELATSPEGGPNERNTP